MLAVFLVGDSHYASVAAALAERGLASDPAGKPTSAHLFVFNAWKHSLTYPFSVAEGDRWVLNPGLRAEMDALRTRLSGPVVLSMFGGGHHHALTLVAPSVPFDCILPSRPELPFDRSAEILTIGFLEAILMSYLPGPFREIDNFLRAFPGAPCFHVESPPLIGDDDFVRENLGRWFTDRLAPGETLELTNRFVRQKVWLLHSGLYLRRAREAGFSFLRCPETTIDDEGFLRREYYGADATHANAAYGEQVLRQVERELNRPIVSWSYFG